MHNVFIVPQTVNPGGPSNAVQSMVHDRKSLHHNRVLHEWTPVAPRLLATVWPSQRGRQ
jgi:hypothetical protein